MCTYPVVVFITPHACACVRSKVIGLYVCHCQHENGKSRYIYMYIWVPHKPPTDLLKSVKNWLQYPSTSVQVSQIVCFACQPHLHMGPCDVLSAHAHTCNWSCGVGNGRQQIPLLIIVLLLCCCSCRCCLWGMSSKDL